MATRALVLAWVVGCTATEHPGETPGRVPANLDAIESAAEDAFDFALAGDVASVRSRADGLSSEWETYRPQAESDGVPAAAISALSAAIEQLTTAAAGTPSSVELARFTNAVSEPMSQFYDVYDPVIPAPVLSLDYLGREVLLDARESDFSRATTDVEALDSTWQALRPDVVGAGGSREASDFDASIDAERAAITASDASALETAARDQLELVDGVEMVYTRG